MDEDILDQAVKLLGPPVRIERHRRWGIWWCPFHPDSQKQGRRGRPNFGIHLEKGYWRCLRCGASGPSLRALARALGEEWKPPKYDHLARPRKRTGPALSLITYALAECRAAFRGSPAERYVTIERRIHPNIAALYGLGYGLPYPHVPETVVEAGRKARLVSLRGWWLWAGGVVYSDPPISTPLFIQVRHLRSKAPSKYQTWGTLLQPGGAWLVSEEETEVLMVAEGLFDMLALATVLHALSLLPRVVPVYTVGGGSAAQLDWLRTQARKGRKVYLIPDPDPGGDAWAERIRERVRVAGVFRPPGRDPDEAILEDGWWPFRF